MKSIFATIAACSVAAIILTCAAHAIHVARYGLSTTTYDLQRGQSLFSARCARCHTITGNSGDVGPNLSQIGSTAPQRKSNMTGPAYILESILNPRAFKSPGSSGEMPLNLVNSCTDDEIRGLVAYLASRGGTVIDEEVRSLTIERPPAEATRPTFDASLVMRGETLYRQKAGCADCHPFYSGPSNELLAPYLFYRGLKDKEQLRRAIVSPHAEVAPRYRQSMIVLNNGQSHSGQFMSRDLSGISLLVRNHRQVTLTEFPLSEIEVDDNGDPVVEQTPLSSMPTGYGQLLSEAELEELLTFILSMN